MLSIHPLPFGHERGLNRRQAERFRDAVERQLGVGRWRDHPGHEVKFDSPVDCRLSGIEEQMRNAAYHVKLHAAEQGCRDDARLINLAADFETGRSKPKATTFSRMQGALHEAPIIFVERMGAIWGWLPRAATRNESDPAAFESRSGSLGWTTSYPSRVA